MTPKTTRASKEKGKKADTTKAKRASKPRSKRASKAAKPTGVQKSTAPKSPKLRKRMTKKKILQNLNEGILEARINMDVDELPSIYKVTDNDANFVPSSEANLTWGSVSNDGVKATVMVRRRGGLSELKKRTQAGKIPAKRATIRGDDMAGAIILDSDVDSGAEDDDVLEKARQAIEEEERRTKFGGRCFFTELPKEVRGEIYGWLLVMERPIVVHCNWTAVQRIAGVDFDINLLRVKNHLIHDEAAEFFYQHNTFYGLVRSANPNWRHPDNIKARFIRNFRDVVVEATEKNAFGNPEDLRMFNTLDALRLADCLLNSLVFVLSPYTIHNAAAQNALLGVVPNASGVAYVDWFKKGSRVYKVLGLLNKYGLRYRELFVVLKLTAGGQEGRVVIRINTVALPPNFKIDQIIGKWQVIKDRIITAAEKAKKEVEQLADNIEKLTGWANGGLNWDGIRVKIAECENSRDEKDRREGPRVRIMGEDESVEGLKWWTRERKAEERARRNKEVRDTAAQSAEQAVDKSTTATPATPAPFELVLGESMMADAWRAHKHRLAELAAAGQFPCAPEAEPAPGPEAAPTTALTTAPISAPVSAPQPEPLPSAAPFSLQAVFNAGASSQMVPEFKPLVDVLSGSQSAPMVVGESGEVEFNAASVLEAPRDGKIGDEEVAGEVCEDVFVDSGEGQVVEGEGLFLPHVTVTREEYDTQMVDVDGMFLDAEPDLVAATGEGQAAGEEDMFFPDINGKAQMADDQVDTHMAEVGMAVDGVGGVGGVEDGVGKGTEGAGMLDVLEAEMMAALEEDLVADGSAHDLFDPDGADL